MASGLAANLIEGIQVAAESIDSGKALEKLELLKKATN
jgi:anthranilate phosphoribosyltransferase